MNAQSNQVALYRAAQFNRICGVDVRVQDGSKKKISLISLWSSDQVRPQPEPHPELIVKKFNFQFARLQSFC